MTTARRDRGALIGFLLVGVVVTGITFSMWSRTTRMPACARGGDMIDLQLARTVDRAADVLSDTEDRDGDRTPDPCDDESLRDLRRTLVLDSAVFVPLYMLSLSYWCLVARRRAPPRTRTAVSGLVAGAIAA
ncbi:MAG TPA: hypothetical protein VG455_04790, partial [Acidimicrobiales bacterium]|nr:hypothetical protein [Acidimicrobiales bacterium]